MNRSLLLVVCDFLLLSILALARFDVPEDATIAKDGQKLVSTAVVERISDGENYDDAIIMSQKKVAQRGQSQGQHAETVGGPFPKWRDDPVLQPGLNEVELDGWGLIAGDRESLRSPLHWRQPSVETDSCAMVFPAQSTAFHRIS